MSFCHAAEFHLKLHVLIFWIAPVVVVVWRITTTTFSLIDLLVLPVLPVAGAQPFSDCSVHAYYASSIPHGTSGASTATNHTTQPSPWNTQRALLHTLLQSTHRRVLPYTDHDSQVDVWRALMDVDPGRNIISNHTVHLIYKNVAVPSHTFGTPETWNREHLWPSSRGVLHTGPDFTDLHHLRPCDWNVNAARSNQYFGECRQAARQDSTTSTSTSTSTTTCRQPATAEAANDTTSDGTVFGPPLESRGDIARALFYMDVRYSGGTGGDDTTDLVLTDCPTKDNEMGYLSQLLQWHMDDPPDDRERVRNDRVCQYWQGNRNVFVDYPELVTVLFGDPQPATISPDGRYSYECGEAMDDADETPNEGNSSCCSSLRPGDVMVTAVLSDDPDLIALVALTDLPPGLQLAVTDNAWTGATFRNNEGTIMLTIPPSGMDRGTVFGYGSGLRYGSQWQRTHGSFALAACGDTLIVYCISDKGGTEPHFLTAFSYSGEEWMVPTSGTKSSALPEELQTVATTLPHYDNYVYVGSTRGSPSVLQDSLRSNENWLGSNSERISVVVTELTLTDTSLGARRITWCHWTAIPTLMILYIWL